MLDAIIKLFLGGLIYRKAKELHDDPEYQDLQKKIDSFQRERYRNPLHGIEFLEITNNISGERLQVAPNDFGDRYKLYDAVKACDKLGSGWRLPTIEELRIMYKELHIKKKGMFKEYSYLGITKADIVEASVFDFKDGDEYEYIHSSYGYLVRPIRDYRFQKQFPMEARSQKPVLEKSQRVEKKPTKNINNRFIKPYEMD
jgi:hypothetical protein